MTVQPTPSQTVGPFYSIGCCRRDDSLLVEPGSAGATRLSGTLMDGAGEPIADGLVEIWDPARRLWGRSGTDEQGRFSFIVPARTPYFEVLVFARGLLRHQWTRIYVENDLDPALAALPDERRATLVAEHAADDLRFHIHMQGDRETVFFAS